MPNDTVIDREVVAFDQEGRPSFNALQNYGSAPAPVVYYVFDMMVLAGRNVMREPLEKRREVLEKKVLPKLPEPVRYSAPLTATLSVLLQSVKVHGFEGLVAKRCNSAYEPDLRTGAWVKMRVNRGQEFVIGGYTRGTKTFDALIFGYFEGDTLFLEWTADNHLRHSEFVGLREDKKARGCRPRMRPVQLVSSPAARDNLQ